jgi:hypothetical protein
MNLGMIISGICVALVVLMGGLVFTINHSQYRNQERNIFLYLFAASLLAFLVSWAAS